MKKMGVKHVNIESIRPNPKNPRDITDSIEPVARSIGEFGFLVPIVINADGVVLSGHARLAAAKSLNMKKVPVVIAEGLSKEQETAFMLADNRLSENASYNTEQLAGLLKELAGADYNLLITGFQPEEIEAFITSATSDLDDILGLGEEGSDDAIMGEEEGQDVRHMHRLMFLLNADEKSVIMEALDGIKKSAPTKLSNGQALTALCLSVRGEDAPN
jgi:ParB-like chromosome segregation protein Spo0J